MIKGVAFDLEGTIVNLEELHFRAFIYAAAQFGLNLTLETLVARIPYALGGGDKRVSRGIAEIMCKPYYETKILSSKREYYSGLLNSLEEIEVRPGFSEVFEQIKLLGLPVAIGSLTVIEQAKIILEQSGIGQLFPKENVVFETDVKNLKPSPDVFIETARRMNIAPSEQLVFEDSATGIAAARLAGSKMVALPVYRFTDNLLGLINAGATRIFLDWREINLVSLITNLNNEIA